MSIKKIHRNLPQLLVSLVQAFFTICIWGRGTGKTRGVTAPWILTRVKLMPRGTSAITTTTYAKMLTNVLPELIQGWEEMGYQLGFHYTVRKLPDEDLNFKTAYRPVVDADGAKHCIFWWNGHQTKLFSLDRGSLSNGESVDCMGVEEARLCNQSLLLETLRTVRGGTEHFGHLSAHGSILMVTDRPRQPHEKWVLDYARQHSEKGVKFVLSCENKLLDLCKQLADEDDTDEKKAIQKQIKAIEADLEIVRKKLVYFSEASTLDNIHVLGVDAIEQMRRTSTWLEYQIACLNRNIIKVERGFYANLSQDKHGYEAYNYDYIDSLDVGAKPDCRWDADIDPYAPLDIAMDNNNAINCIAVGQMQETEESLEYRLLNTLWVTHPQLLKAVVDKFIAYYKYHPCQEVNLIYDNTANKSDASDDTTFADEVKGWLEAAGFIVNLIYVGQASEHHDRYEKISKMLNDNPEAVDKVFDFRYNVNTCKDWEYAASQTGILIEHNKKRGTVLKKDKRSEKKAAIPPQESTHLTEAVDGLLMYRLETPFTKKSILVDSLFS